jgi:hypothetical protein
LLSKEISVDFNSITLHTYIDKTVIFSTIQFNQIMHYFPYLKKENIGWLNIISSIILTGVLCYWAFQLFTQFQPQTLLEFAKFPIHEYLGGILGGLSGNEVMIAFIQNLTDILVPLFFLFYFLHQKQYISALFGLFWTGDSLIGLGIYMADAVKLQLNLCSGWFYVCGSGSDTEDLHDWHIIFSAWNLLPESEIIGGIVHVLGILCVIASLVGLVYVIWKRIESKLIMMQPDQTKALVTEIMQDIPHTNDLTQPEMTKDV